MHNITVMHAGGDRFRIYVRGHELQADQPREDGGQDLAPTPTELFVASLASCVAFYARRFMRRHLLAEHVEVTAEYAMAERPARVGEIVLHVEAPGVPSSMRERFEAVIDHCTVHNSLEQIPSITLDTHTAPAVTLVP